ncbi:MAG: hypothetical protein ABEK84_05165, partial [Salinibacter sp.]
MRPRLALLGLAIGIVIGPLLLMGAGCAGSEESAAPDTLDVQPPSAPIFDVRAVTLDARNRPDSSLLVRLRNLGVTHLTLVSFGWQESVSSPDIEI